MPNALAAKDINWDINWKNYPFSGNTCIRVGYKNNSGTRWAGILLAKPSNELGNYS